MKLKLRLMFLLGGLLFIPTISIFSSSPRGCDYVDEFSENFICKSGQRETAHIKVKCHKKRNVLSSYGYLEENTLYLFFSSPLENVSLDITNADTGALIFSGRFTGTHLSIPLEDYGLNFIINVN